MKDVRVDAPLDQHARRLARPPQAREREERFAHFRSEVFGRLVWTMGAIAAEEIFYGENTTGVGGDMQSATTQAALMVGVWAMGPQRVDFGDRFRPAGRGGRRAREDHRRASGEIGEALLIARRRRGNPMHGRRPDQRRARRPATSGGLRRRSWARRTSPPTRFIAQNRAAVESIADTLIERARAARRRGRRAARRRRARAGAAATTSRSARGRGS